MNPHLVIAEHLALSFEAFNSLLGAMVIASFGLLMIAGYACFLAIERFRKWNHRDESQRDRERMLLEAEQTNLRG